MSATKIDSSDDIEESIFSSDPDLDGYEEELEESGNDEKNGDACASKDKFVESCAKEFRESDFLDKLFHKLQRVGLLNDFINFMRNLESGELPMDNIVFILMMDRVRFNNCPNTVGMRYGKKSKMFWTIVYRLCKESRLKFFSGSKNWGQVVNKECEKSKYSPDNAKINFAVPDEKVLRAYKSGLPKVIPPGKIDKCMEMLRNKKDIVLMADSKLVTKGLKTDFLGDVNLFGHERNPNLQSFLKRDNSINNVDKAISACKTNMYTSAIWIKKALKCNLQLCKMMATLQHNLHLFKTNSRLDIHSLHNGRFLKNCNYVSSNVTFTEYPNLIKRYSDM